MKPTKQQVKDAIAIMADCPMSLINYDYKKKEYSIFEMIPVPHYHSGHGIDAMDYEEIPRTMSWKDALQVFRDYKNSLNMSCMKTLAPIALVKADETDLPF